MDHMYLFNTKIIQNSAFYSQHCIDTFNGRKKQERSNSLILFIIYKYNLHSSPNEALPRSYRVTITLQSFPGLF